jgi:hypothetical protein
MTVLQSLGITRRENQERQLATRLSRNAVRAGTLAFGGRRCRSSDSMESYVRVPERLFLPVQLLSSNDSIISATKAPQAARTSQIGVQRNGCNGVETRPSPFGSRTGKLRR